MVRKHVKVFCSLRWFLWCPFLPFQRSGAEQTLRESVALKPEIKMSVCLYWWTIMCLSCCYCAGFYHSIYSRDNLSVFQILRTTNTSVKDLNRPKSVCYSPEVLKLCFQSFWNVLLPYQKPAWGMLSGKRMIIYRGVHLALFTTYFSMYLVSLLLCFWHEGLSALKLWANIRGKTHRQTLN